MHSDSLRETVVLVGASVRAAAASARQAGFQVVGIDQFGDADTRKTCAIWLPLKRESLAEDVQRALQSLPGSQPSGQASTNRKPAWLVWTGGVESGTGLENGAGLTSPGKVILAFPADATINRLRQPDFLADCAAAAEVGFPPWTKKLRQEMIGTARGGERGKVWLRKKIASAGGVDVRWADGWESSEGEYFQRFVPGKLFGASFLADGKKGCFLGAAGGYVHRTPAAPFLYGGSVGPVALERRFREGIERVAEQVIERTGLRGLFGIDAFYSERAPNCCWLLEINPRYTASMEVLERAAGRSFLADHLRMWGWSEGGVVCPRETGLPKVEEPAVDRRGAVWTKRILWTRKEVCWPSSWGQHEIEKLGIQCADIPTPGTLIAPHAPLLTMLLKGSQPYENLVRIHRAACFVLDAVEAS